MFTPFTNNNDKNKGSNNNIISSVENTSISTHFDKFKYIPAETGWIDIAGNSNIIREEMSKREPFTSVFYTSNDVPSINDNINTINRIQEDINRNKENTLQNYTDISQNVGTYINDLQYLITHNSKYYYDDHLDPTSILSQKTPADIKVAVNEDINTIKLHQNSIYITSAIACATLLIAAIMIAPSK
jgi:hypothetical protein